MRTLANSSTAMVSEPVEVQTQEHQQGPSQAAAISSKLLVAKKPTTSSSQKDVVSKKKRKEVNLVEIPESADDQIVLPLVKKPKKSKQIELTTHDTSVSSQKGTVENEPIKECAQPAPRVYGRRNKDGTHCEDTSIEAPSSIQGW